MLKKNFILTMQRKMATTAIGPSALRRQGKNILKASQSFLAKISLARIPKSGEKQFKQWLNRQTGRLLVNLPVKNRPWGAARKAINLFLRDALYNQYLNRTYRLNKIEKWLEIPLDSAVAKGLKSWAGRGNLPRWPGLKHLDAAESTKFQKFALCEARTCKISRVHLDMYLWLENR